MTQLRSILLLTLALLALFALTGRPVFELADSAQPPAAEARHNPHLALGRLMQALGAEIRMERELSITRLPPAAGSTLWLVVPGRMLSLAETDALRAWVHAGGRLILAPQQPALWRDDPLLASIGLTLATYDDEWLQEQLGDDAHLRDNGQHGFRYAVGNGHAVDAAFDPARGIEPLEPEEDAPGAALFCDPVGCHAWRVPHGRGEFIALAEAWPFGNAALAQHDHAAIARLLVQPAPGRHFHLVYEEQVPSLFALLWQHAAFAVLALAAAVLLWILAAGRRFGPLQAGEIPARRRLAEHIAATGRLLAASGHRRALWQAAHDDFRRTLHRRHPQAHGMNDEALAALLAQHAGGDPRQVHAALAVPPADADDIALASAIRRLDTLRRLL
ncbi:MAG: DUF4350 domain-containing protein [Pseudomonadota bacterium]